MSVLLHFAFESYTQPPVRCSVSREKKQVTGDYSRMLMGGCSHVCAGCAGWMHGHVCKVWGLKTGKFHASMGCQWVLTGAHNDVGKGEA